MAKREVYVATGEKGRKARQALVDALPTIVNRPQETEEEREEHARKVAATLGWLENGSTLRA
jgi:hypothetical protein